ncbi:MAG: universal stress protein [Balneolaceae bacterium]|nr:universal stress protein [Balneolaceae bacterium]
MNQERPTIYFRRILVALDTSAHSRAALHAAAQLAKLAEAELKGLYVSDATWHRLGKLSLIKEISEITGESRSLGEEEMEKQSELIKKRIEDYLSKIARSSGISYSLNSVRGSIGEELLKAAEGVDLITIGRTGHSHKQEDKLGKTARYIIKHAQKPVLVLEQGLTIGNAPIICIYDGTEQSQRGLKLALNLAKKQRNQLQIIGLANQSESIQNRNKEIEEHVQNAKVQVRLNLLNQDNIWNLTRMLNKMQGSLLIIPKNQPLIKDEWAGKIFNMAKCPMLLMN